MNEESPAFTLKVFSIVFAGFGILFCVAGGIFRNQYGNMMIMLSLPFTAVTMPAGNLSRFIGDLQARIDSLEKKLSEGETAEIPESSPTES